MPPIKNSRYQYSLGVTDTSGRTFLTEPPRITYGQPLDNVVHVVQGGERLLGLGSEVLRGLRQRHLPGCWPLVRYRAVPADAHHRPDTEAR